MCSAAKSRRGRRNKQTEGQTVCKVDIWHQGGARGSADQSSGSDRRGRQDRQSTEWLAGERSSKIDDTNGGDAGVTLAIRHEQHETDASKRMFIEQALNSKYVNIYALSKFETHNVANRAAPDYTGEQFD